MRDVRIALGVDTWHVWGASYGTAVAMAIAHLYPETTTSAVLDSVSLNAPDWRQRTGPNYESSLSRLFALCRADKSCTRRYGDVEALYEKALQEISSVPLRERLASNEKPFAFNRQDFLLSVYQMLYSPQAIRLLPLVFERVAARDVRFAANLSVATRPGIVQRAFGVHYAIDCQGRGTGNLEVLDSAFLGELFPLTAYYHAVCQALDLTNSDPQSQPVKPSDVPALIMTGAIDPITPPHTAREAASDFRTKTLVELPRLGHAVSLQDDCAKSIMLAFLDAPERTLDLGCTTDIPAVKFVDEVWINPDLMFRLTQGWTVSNMALLAGVAALIICLLIALIALFQAPAGGFSELGLRLSTILLPGAALFTITTATALTLMNDQVLLLFGLPAYAGPAGPLLYLSSLAGCATTSVLIMRKAERVIILVHAAVSLTTLGLAFQL